MRGRKPIYSQEECLDIAQRLAAGESPSAIGRAMGKDGKPIPRTSVLQCAKSARLPPALREQVLLQLKAKNVEKLLSLWGDGVDAVLRRIKKLAPKADEKGVSLLSEALERFKSIMPTVGGGVQAKISKVTDETRLIFERKVGVQQVSIASVEKESPSGLGGSNPDAHEAGSSAAAPIESGPAEAA